MNPQEQFSIEPNVQQQIEQPIAPQPVNPASKKSKYGAVIALLAVVAIGGLAFGGFEFWQNTSLDKENKELKASVEEYKKLAENDEQEDSSDVDVLEYEYNDDSVPGATYKVRLSYDDGELYVYEHSYCSAVDCEDSEHENMIKLTDEELNKVRTIVRGSERKKGYLTSALASLVYGDKAMTNYYAEYDLNNDGIVTQREFGNSFLDSMIEESR